MTAHPRDNFEDTDTICLTCLIDEHLRTLEQPRSQVAECCVCEAAAVPTIRVGDLAEIVDTALRKYFTWGAEVQKFRDDNDDIGWSARRGYEMSDLFSVVLPRNFPIPNTLQRAIGDRDEDRRDGGEPFWSDDMRYQGLRPTLEEERKEWDLVAEELKHERRFFSQRAAEFFGWLFEGIDDFYSLEGSVVRDIVPGTLLCRARRCDSWQALRGIAGDPAQELGPPPAAFAKAGRMNAAGVPVFYGALERDTSIAEMRAPLGGQLAVAQFSLTRNARVLDFRRLAKAQRRSPPSVFRPDYERLIARHRFTVVIHQLIRTPIVPEHEAEYLITQAMAEYLAHVRQPRFDGVVFGSAQEDSGSNVVLFEPAPLIHYVSDSLTFHQITHVKYDSKKLELVRAGVEPAFLYDPMAVYDDEQ